MEPVNLLERYQEDRDQLLHTISDFLETDPYVKAAWLFGSLGRGDEDALSDIDLWVVVDDEQIENVIAQPRQFTYQVGYSILTLEAPQNAPEGGAYLMTCYDTPIAPHLVDWYWQPRSLAYIPAQVRLLFDRAGLVRKDEPILFPGRPAAAGITERPGHFVSYFWMMYLIAAKHAFRSPWSEQMEFLPQLTQTMAQAQKYLGQDDILLLRNLPPTRSPGEKIQLLHQFADEMRKIMAALSERGEEAPVNITPGIDRYLKLVELALEDKIQDH